MFASLALIVSVYAVARLLGLGQEGSKGIKFIYGIATMIIVLAMIHIYDNASALDELLFGR